MMESGIMVQQQIIEATQRQPPAGKMSYEEFLNWADEDTLKETYLDGPADLVVEIVSPDSVGRDRGDKFYKYAQGGCA
jgi:Uma2 family endonuclease